MKDTIHFTKYKVFSKDEMNFGNPVAVIETTNEEDTDFQTIASQLNEPVTVFLIFSQNDSEQPRIRFFYPKRETNICVHGALAAAAHLLRKRSINSIEIINRDNTTLFLSKGKNDNNSDRYFIDLKIESFKRKYFDQKNDHKKILEMLSLAESDIDPNLSFEIASVGSLKLLIPVRNFDILKNLKLNMTKISKWSEENNVNGFYVYTSETLDNHSNFHARNFNPLSGQDEDIATGIAAAALAWRISQNNKINDYVIEQGFFLGNPCVIYVNVGSNTIQVGGNVAALP